MSIKYSGLSKKQLRAQKRQADAHEIKRKNCIAFVRRLLIRRGAKISMDPKLDCFRGGLVSMEDTEVINGCHVGRIFGCSACSGAPEAFRLIESGEIDKGKALLSCRGVSGRQPIYVDTEAPEKIAPFMFNTGRKLLKKKAGIQPILSPTELAVRQILSVWPFGVFLPNPVFGEIANIKLPRQTAVVLVDNLGFIWPSPNTREAIKLSIMQHPIGASYTLYHDQFLEIQVI